MQASLRSTIKGTQKQRGFTVMEVTLALVIFTMMTLLFGAVLPMAVRGAQHSGNYNQAAALAQRKIDQLRIAGYSRLFDNTDGTARDKLITQNIVDGQVAAGVYDFTTVDHMTGAGGYFPPDSAGTITIVDGTNQYTPGQGGNVAVATVTITWGGTVPGSYSASAIIVSMLHQ